MNKFTAVQKISSFFRTLDNKIEDYTRHLIQELEKNMGS